MRISIPPIHRGIRPTLEDYTRASGLTAFVCAGHARKSRQVFKCLSKKVACQGRALGIPIAPKFLGDTVGLETMLVNTLTFAWGHHHLPLEDKSCLRLLFSDLVSVRAS